MMFIYQLEEQVGIYMFTVCVLVVMNVLFWCCVLVGVIFLYCLNGEFLCTYVY